MNVKSNYSVYLTTGPERHHPKAPYGGDHITVAKCQKFNGPALKEIVNEVANKNLANQACHLDWQPKKWEISIWKGRYTMVIKSKRLIEVANQLENKGVQHLMGPGNGKAKFHVTLPKAIKSQAEAIEYAKQLSTKNWHLTVVHKDKPYCRWVDYAPLKQ